MFGPRFRLARVATIHGHHRFCALCVALYLICVYLESAAVIRLWRSAPSRDGLVFVSLSNVGVVHRSCRIVVFGRLLSFGGVVGWGENESGVLLGTMGMERRSGISDLANGGRAKSTKMARSGSTWLQTDPEMRRKKRVAKYKVFTVEAKVKQTVRNSCRWIKAKFFEVRYGWY